MVQFEHVLSFTSYCVNVWHELRYLRTTETEAFLQAVLATASKREQTINSGTILWRAQLGAEEISPFEPLQPFPFERMKPLDRRAAEGRANPKGIPVLYLATERDTAMREVRPWIGSRISVASFKTNQDLRVIDCSMGSAGTRLWPKVYKPDDDSVPPDAREHSNWTDIDLAFAEPVDRSDDIADYAATQIIAELFKREQYDGIKYRSALSTTGHNVALFDISAADPVSCELFKVSTLDFKFELI
jgi:RES domain-containing protein